MSATIYVPGFTEAAPGVAPEAPAEVRLVAPNPDVNYLGGMTEVDVTATYARPDGGVDIEVPDMRNGEEVRVRVPAEPGMVITNAENIKQRYYINRKGEPKGYDAFAPKPRVVQRREEAADRYFTRGNEDARPANRWSKVGNIALKIVTFQWRREAAAPAAAPQTEQPVRVQETVTPRGPQVYYAAGYVASGSARMAAGTPERPPHQPRTRMNTAFVGQRQRAAADRAAEEVQTATPVIGADVVLADRPRGRHNADTKADQMAAEAAAAAAVAEEIAREEVVWLVKLGLDAMYGNNLGLAFRRRTDVELIIRSTANELRAAIRLEDDRYAAQQLAQLKQLGAEYGVNPEYI